MSALQYTRCLIATNFSFFFGENPGHSECVPPKIEPFPSVFARVLQRFRLPYGIVVGHSHFVMRSKFVLKIFGLQSRNLPQSGGAKNQYYFLNARCPIPPIQHKLLLQNPKCVKFKFRSQHEVCPTTIIYGGRQRCQTLGRTLLHFCGHLLIRRFIGLSFRKLPDLARTAAILPGCRTRKFLGRIAEDPRSFAETSRRVLGSFPETSQDLRMACRKCRSEPGRI